mgnify:CR=1 FL=1
MGVRQPKKIHVLGEFLDSIPGGHEPDLRTYDEALQDKDAASWQRAMNTELEYMYSNKIWKLVEPPNGVKRSIIGKEG